MNSKCFLPSYDVPAEIDKMEQTEALGSEGDEQIRASEGYMERPRRILQVNEIN